MLRNLCIMFICVVSIGYAQRKDTMAFRPITTPWVSFTGVRDSVWTFNNPDTLGIYDTLLAKGIIDSLLSLDNNLVIDGCELDTAGRHIDTLTGCVDVFYKKDSVYFSVIVQKYMDSVIIHRFDTSKIKVRFDTIQFVYTIWQDTNKIHGLFYKWRDCIISDAILDTLYANDYNNVLAALNAYTSTLTVGGDTLTHLRQAYADSLVGYYLNHIVYKDSLVHIDTLVRRVFPFYKWPLRRIVDTVMSDFVEVGHIYNNIEFINTEYITVGDGYADWKKTYKMPINFERMNKILISVHASDFNIVHDYVDSLYTVDDIYRIHYDTVDGIKTKSLVYDTTLSYQQCTIGNYMEFAIRFGMGDGLMYIRATEKNLYGTVVNTCVWTGTRRLRPFLLGLYKYGLIAIILEAKIYA